MQGFNRLVIKGRCICWIDQTLVRIEHPKIVNRVILYRDSGLTFLARHANCDIVSAGDPPSLPVKGYFGASFHGNCRGRVRAAPPRTVENVPGHRDHHSRVPNQLITISPER
jgi:hypothetical protein